MKTTKYMKMTKYKMRAECQADLGRFLARVPVTSFTAEGSHTFPIPDMSATFTSRLSIYKIKEIIGEIEDGHIMLETLATADSYTGERVALQVSQ